MMKVIWRLLMGTEAAAASTSLAGGTSVCGVGRRNAKRRRFDARDVIGSGLTRGARSTFADNGLKLSQSL
jgi:hypothetical protein